MSQTASYLCHAYLGDVDKSLAALETSLDHKHVLLNWLLLTSDPALSPIREDLRFQAMDQGARAELARQHENIIAMELETRP